ncbi:hypothetical protein NEF87_001944 [Candidatus Lokiarchaeum ossiferum]|uniref:YkgJ family cysteine cluster protein n=1 Tax=Candidatus Lokiarchaeum ossiferum TaxID=2951803 RepID=A0ABY6HT63_9ARCH|nr:hypothetical protein NEF87_001944 [Candidatus Lokiarchaeum sp. B-35]
MERFSEPLLSLILNINKKCTSSISGTNCLDSEVCQGACCYSSQEISFAGAKALIEANLAQKSDFIRSDTLAFRIRLSPETKRCIFFDPNLNGCKIFHSNLRPAQCCVFPIQFDKTKHQCRMQKEFFIETADKMELKETTDRYIDLAREEALFLESEDKISQKFNISFISELRDIPPKHLFGVKEIFDEFHPLVKSKISFSLMDFCNIHGCDTIYEQCSGVCDQVINLLISDFVPALRQFIKNKGPKEEYFFQSLLDL